MASDSSSNSSPGHSSVSAFLWTFIPSLIIAVVCFGAFLFLRQRNRRVYEPRAEVDFLAEEQKSAAPGPGLKGFLQALWYIADTDVLTHQSLDAYLFLRYLKICTAICFVGCVITWPILFPVNATGGADNVVQMDVLSMAKISNKNRYYAQALVAWIFFTFVIFIITRESLYFINLRNAYSISKGYQDRLSSRTVLFTNIPGEFQDKQKLLDFFAPNAKNAWVVTDCKELTELVKERDDTALKLEKAEINISKTAYGNYLKAEKKKAKIAKKGGKQISAASPPAGEASAQPAVNPAAENTDYTALHGHPDPAMEGNARPVVNPATDNANHAAPAPAAEKGTISAANDEESGLSASAHSQWIQPKDRPTHRLKFLIGKKVDTVKWCQNDLTEKIPQVEKEQQKHVTGEASYTNSAFVEFASLEAAQVAIQRSYKSSPLKGVDSHFGIQPHEVIWKNLDLSRTSRRLKSLIAIVLIILLIIFWAIPVAVVGAISNINFLTSKVHFLRFINDIPSVILGVVTGLLPVVALSILMSLVPVFCKILAKASGVVSTAHVELWCQQWYYAFNVIQVFLVVTIASAATTVVIDIINDPSSATSLLANNLPNAANFYISYFVLQGLSIASMGLLQIGGLVGFRVLGRFLDKTPRKMHKRWTTLANNSWGVLYPKFALLCMIPIIYSCIAPLVLGFATVGIFLMYLGFKYNFLFVFTTDVSTNGAAYPRALQHLMVGVYLGELCLLGLVGIKAATGPIVIVAVLLVATIIYHIMLNLAIDPYLKYLPLVMFEHEHRKPLVSRTAHGGEPSDAVADEDKSEEGNDVVPLPPRSMAFLTKLFHVGQGWSGPEPGPGNFVSRYIKVNYYSSPARLSSYMPLQKYGVPYDETIIQQAYLNPAITSPAPVVWIAKDPLGISTEEIAKTDAVIHITDNGAHINEKNKVVWDMENASTPVIQRPTILY